MLVMRVKYEFSPDVMEIDEEISECFFKDLQTLGVMRFKRMWMISKMKANLKKSNDASIQSKIEVFPNVQAIKTSLKKKRNMCHSYNAYQNQIGRFLHLVTKQVPVRTVATDAGINLSSAYLFRKQ
jgi:hypothetical protein